MQAIILAAGMGKRLGKLTQNNTKCMVEVGGVRLIERALYILDKKKLSRIVMVVGYQCENLMQFVDGLGIDTPVEYIINEVYDRTNNIYSLSMAKDWLVKEDTLLLESDLIFEEALIDRCLRIRARRWRLWTSLKTGWTGHVWLWMRTTGLSILFRESCWSIRRRSAITRRSISTS